MGDYKKQRFILLATDPVHIGTGGYRLGRVDNSIVREPGTKVPKIPGTSLHGAIRSYAAVLYENVEAAGKDHHKIIEPEKDPICYTFGYVGGGEGKAYSGTVNIFDAQILFFPVSSMAGPVWVTTLERLEEAGFEWRFDKKYPADWEKSKVFLSWKQDNQTNKINLGWLMLKIAEEKIELNDESKITWKKDGLWKKVRERLVVVQEALFSHIVNSNLEVRTSVAIDPERGAAADGALFTYEAIPRGTFLVMEVVVDDYRSQWPLKEDKVSQTKNGNKLPGDPWHGSLDVVKAGLRLMEWLGVGGMGTRGFGRLALAAEFKEELLTDLYKAGENKA